jgi:MFS transporter, DHA1 family, solute carrier family 18 (vesicular amine transporter), member 1/2
VVIMTWLAKLRTAPTTGVVVVAVALFTDSYLYGMVVPLTHKSPAGIQDTASLGILFGGYALGMMVSTPVWGILSDRLGRRRPLVWGVLGQVGATALFGFADTYLLMLLARVVQGVAAAATWTAGLALIAQTFPHKRTQMMGLVMMGGNGGSVLGPIAGGMLYDWGGSYRFPFLIAGGLLVVDGLMRWTLITEPPRQAGERPDLPGLLRDRSVWAAAGVVVLGVGGWGILEPLLPEHLERVSHVSPGIVGLMFSVATLFYGLAAPLVEYSAERWGLRPTITAGLILMALSLPLVALPVPPFWTGAALCLVSILYAFALNPTFTELAEAVDRQGTGGFASVYAIYNMAYGVGMVGSDSLAGFLANAISLAGALLITCLVMLGSVPLLYLTYSRSRAIPLGSGSVSLTPITNDPSGDPS